MLPHQVVELREHARRSVRAQRRAQIAIAHSSRDEVGLEKGEVLQEAEHLEGRLREHAEVQAGAPGLGVGKGGLLAEDGLAGAG